MTEVEIYRAAMDTFGKVKQTIKLHEEIGEFMAAFAQYSEGRDKLSHVAEEMADVHNMLDQWAVQLGCVEEVERQKRYKLKRLEQRIEKAKLESNLRVLESNLRVAEPLTEEELLGMIGEPAWVEDQFGAKSWYIVSESLLGLYGGYKAYRHKPEEVQSDGRN